MKVLITGDAGFIASRVKQTLLNEGHEIVGFDLARGEDLLDLEVVEQKISDVDIVYHIAAQADLTIMSKNIEACRTGVLNNIDATHNVAYACAKYGKWLIYASTLCVYGNVSDHPSKEDQTLPSPSEIYACSKYAGEWIVRGYGLSYHMPWTILRFATIYGPGMRSALGLHVFFRQALNNDPVTLHGDGEQNRTLTYIDDLVEGIVAPLKYPHESRSNIINLSSPISISARKMAEDVIAVVNSKSEIVSIPQRKNQTIHEDIDTSKAKKILRWEAKTGWEDGLRLTHEWMLTQLK